MSLDPRPSTAALHAADVRHAAGAIRHAHDGGAESLAICTTDGRWVQLHSRRDPVAEADRLVAPLFDTGALPPVVFIVGAGLGYAIDAIERRSPATRVLALEPFADVAPVLLDRRRRAGRAESPHVRVLIGPDYRGSADAWRMVGSAVSPPVLVHPVLRAQFPAEVARAERVVSRIVEGAAANEDARRRFAGPYLLNTLANLPALWREGDAADLAGEFAGVPAVVVGAGPSLDRALAPLARIQERVLVIAVDTALRPLLAAGITPHLVVAVDPQDANARHLQGVTGTDGVWLVSEGSLPGRVFEPFPGRTFLFQVSDHQPWPWLSAHSAGRGKLRAWGSVLTSAFDLALTAGSTPIAFVGADLSYPAGQMYCRNTIYDREESSGDTADARRAATAARLLTIVTTSEPDVAGSPAVTTAQFIQFRDWIVSTAAEAAHARVINATGAGILHGAAIEQCAPDHLDALADPSARPPGLRTRIAAAWSRSSPRRAEAAAALSAVLLDPRASLPIDTWVEFAAGGASREGIGVRLDLARVAAMTDAAFREGWAGSPRAILPRVEPYWTRADTVARPLAAADACGGTLVGSDRVRSAIAVAEFLRSWWSRSAMPVSHALDTTLPHAAGLLGSLIDAIVRPDRQREANDGSERRVAVRVTRETPGAPRVSVGLPPMSIPVGRVLRYSTGLLVRRVPRALFPAGDIRPVAPIFPPRVPLGRATTSRGTALELQLECPRAGGWTASEEIVGAVEPIVLSGHGPIGQPVQLDDESVVVTRLYQPRSLVVDSHGRVRAGHEWPAAIRAELPLGGRGGAVAWTDGRSNPRQPETARAWWRDTADALPRAMDLPFRPGMGVALPGGRVAWACVDHGLGSASEHGSIAMAGAPSLFSGLVALGDAVMASEIALDGRQLRPEAAARARVWDAVSGALTSGPEHGDAGPISSRATRGAWTADCHFLASVIRLTRGDGLVIDLSCHEPNRAAWAGDSLVVAVMAWDVLVFPNLLGALEAAAGRSPSR